MIKNEKHLYRLVIVCDRGNLEDISFIFKYLSSNHQGVVDSASISIDKKRVTIILTADHEFATNLTNVLRELKEKRIIIDFFTIEPKGNLLPMKRVFFVDDNKVRMRIHPVASFVRIFLNIYDLLSEKGEFVVERIGYYYGRSHIETLLKEGVIEKPSVFKALAYCVLTGVSLGLYSLENIEVKTSPLSSQTTIVIKMKNYYEEEEYRRNNVMKCGIYQLGFLRGVIEYFIEEKNYKVEELVCYDENERSVFEITLPLRITKEERDFLKEITTLLRDF